ncbi:hypothetical protein [Novosphingobium sp. BL-52-GroH]
MSYRGVASMLAASTVVMFALRYLNTYVASHMLFSQTRLWLALRRWR